jgi:hypothetical protein
MQEVTPLILEILSNMEWWEQYSISPHPRDMTYFTLLLVKRSAAPSLQEGAFKHREFHNSVMGECIVDKKQTCKKPNMLSSIKISNHTRDTRTKYKQHE